MIALITFILFFVAIVKITLPYIIWTVVAGALLLFGSIAGLLSGWVAIILWLIFIPLALLNIVPLRKQIISASMLEYTRKVLPPISDTEQEAIDAGTVWWEAELFKGNPDWDKLHSIPVPKLTKEEQTFMDGPTEKLCKMVDDWQVTHQLNDLPTSVWTFLLGNKFFAINIPKEYGGLGFSPIANSAIVSKVASRSGTAGVTVVLQCFQDGLICTIVRW